MAESDRPTGLAQPPDSLSSDSAPLVPEERRRLILEMLRSQRSVSVTALEEHFDISPMTARRDLAILARSGLARRTHGGAVLPDLAAHEDSFRHRLELESDEKRRIAQAVVATLEPGETLFVDSSTSAWYVAEAITTASIPLTILTSSLPVINLVADADVPNLDLVALGGSFRTLTRSFVGPDVVRALRGYRADRLVFAVKGITAGGDLTDAEPLEAEVKRTMIAYAKTVVLLATATKFEDRGRIVVGSVEDVDVVYVTGLQAAHDAMLGAHGVAVERV
jgi:DeoR/GlpR family transcriptional regulator of sugar metabolism